MATDAVILDRLPTVGRYCQVIGIQAPKEKNHVFGAVVSFPKDMINKIIVGQMTFNTIQMAMVGVLQPGIVLIFHNMTAGAEFRRRSLVIQTRRTKKQEQKQPHQNPAYPQNLQPNPPPQLHLNFIVSVCQTCHIILNMNGNQLNVKLFFFHSLFRQHNK